MAGFSIVLNPTSDPQVTHTAQLDLSDAAVNNGVGYRPTMLDFPPPSPKPAYASSYDTEGSVSSDEAHYDNREISGRIRVIGSSAANLEAKLNALYKMVGQINREGGSLKLTTPAGTVCYFDLEREGAAATPFDQAYAGNRRAEVDVRFVARPFWRGAEVDLGSVSETTLPALVLTVPMPSTDTTGITLTAASSEVVERSDEAALDLGDTFTMEAWIKRGTTGTNQAVMSKGNNAYLMRFETDNTLALLRSQVAVIVKSTTTITDTTTWHHVVATKSGATVKLYIDGVDRTGTVSNQTFTDNALPFRAGSDTTSAPAATDFWNGSMYGVALYSTALSGARVATHAAQTTAAGYATEVLADTPVLFWKLSEPSGTTAEDSTANNRDGTYVNTPTLGVTGPLTGSTVTVDGDVPALGRLVVTEADGDDRWIVIVGGESRYYNSGTASTTSALFLQAEDLTPTGTSTDTAGAAGASGTNVIRNTDLTTTYQAILKSEIDASNAALTHKGTYRVWGRLYRPTGNTGAVSVRLEWAEGDYRKVAQNDPVTFAANELEGLWVLVDLGVVSLDPESTRWEFRLLAKSTVVGDELDADCFGLFPTEVVYSELSAKARFENPSSFTARDEFDQTAGDLGAKAAPVGGNWDSAGDTTPDFTLDTSNHRVTRTDTTGSSACISVLDGSSTLSNIGVQADLLPSLVSAYTTTGAQAGVVCRYVDTSNYLVGGLQEGAGLVVVKRVAGAETILAQRTDVTMLTDPNLYSFRLVASAAGHFWLWRFPSGRPFGGEPVLAGSDSVLATGGALDDGKIGILHRAGDGASATTARFDNFLAFVPTVDAAMFANQSLSLEHDRATREDSTGTFSTNISDRRGRYLKIPPAGPEGRSTRLIVWAPGGPTVRSGVLLDPGIFDTSAQLYVTPRGLVVPES